MTFNWLDLLTTILGLAYILLEYRASVWMWVVGFVMQLMGIVLYYQKGLYADCAMEGYYCFVTIYGFWRWVAPKRPVPAEQRPAVSPPSDTPKPSTPITHVPRRIILPWVVATLGLWALIWWLLTTFTDSTVPVADSFTTALSLLGVWALAHKYLEQWFVWIVVDVVTCVLYAYKDLPFKSGLYALYVIIAVFGYFRWRRMMRTAQ